MNNLVVATGLQNLQTQFIQNWIGPAFLICVAFFAIMFIKEREFRKLASFVVIAAIVALLIYGGPKLFGESGKLKKAAEDIVDTVNTINYFNFLK